MSKFRITKTSDYEYEDFIEFETVEELFEELKSRTPEFCTEYVLKLKEMEIEIYDTYRE